MLVGEVMSKDVLTVTPDVPLQHLAKRMVGWDVTFVPVVEDQSIVGHVTDRDVLTRSVASGHNPRMVPVKDIMRREIFLVFEDDDIGLAAESMREHGTDCLVVADRAGQLVGTLSLGDLALRWRDHQMTGEILHRIQARRRRR